MKKEQVPVHDLRVGDCLKCVWGYDQTNVDYYQVIALKGRTMVTVRQIDADHRPSSHNFMVGKTTPLKDKFIGGPFSAKVGKGYHGAMNCIRITSYSHASKCEWSDVANWTGYA